MTTNGKSCGAEPPGASVLVAGESLDHGAALDAAFDHSPTGSAVLDGDGRMLRVNDAFVVLVGRPLSELIGAPLRSLFHDEDAARGRHPTAGREHPTTVYCRLTHPDGHVLRVQVSLSGPMPDLDGRMFAVAHLLDLSALQSLTDQLDAAGTTDSLTGLPNREGLRAILSRSLANRRDPLLIGHFDLRRFGLINNALGRTVGDLALIEVARRLRGALGPGDTVGRVGDDEFVAVVPTSSGVRGGHLTRSTVRHLLEVVAEPLDVGGYRLVIDARVGVARSASGEAASELLAHAEAAVYLAKRQGSQVGVWDAGVRDRAYGRLKIEGALRQADFDAELLLHYQPVWDLASGVVGSVEALLRWEHPALGRIGPDRLLPVAVDLDMTAEIGDWVLRRATSDVVEWRRAHPGSTAKVAVNLSGEHVGDPGLVESVCQAVDASGDPEVLIVEITEQALVTASAPVLRRLRRLSDLGVEIHLDDFGTGYSSLAYLNRLPVDGLKVDRQFVSGDTGLLLLRTIARLGRELGKVVVAEGVETEAQLRAVRSTGCTMAQGYLLGRPGPDLDAALAPVARDAAVAVAR